MEVFRTEVHAFLLRPFIDDTREALGEAKLDALLGELGAQLSEIDDPNAWVSLRFFEAFMDLLERERGDPTLLERCGRMAISQRYLGFLRPLFHAFGTPMFAYGQIVQATGRFNKVGQMKLVERGDHRVTISYRPLPDAPPERAKSICRARAANLEAVPTMFDLPPAQMKHPRCIHSGDDACIYEFTWQAQRSTVAMWAGFAAGGLAGGAMAWLLGAGVSIGSVLTGLGLMAGGALGRSVRLSRELGSRAQELAEQQDALTESAVANERRFAELQQAKAEVDEKVEQRTAELRETSQRLEETLQQVQDLDRAKTDFFANVSHELRTPLTLILGPLEELLAGKEPAGGAYTALSTMHRNASRLLVLINQLLDLTRIDAGKVELERTSADPVSLAQRAVEAFQSAAHARNVTIEVDAPAPVRSLPLDAGWIESALTNLIANALRQVSEGGCITVRAVDRGADVLLEVEDDGPGIDSPDPERVFDRFSRPEQEEDGTGTGLGLAIVRETARLHGGEATVQSEPGRGASFSLVLPRVLADARQTEDEAEPVGTAARGAPRAAAEPSAARSPEPAGEGRDTPEARAPAASQGAAVVRHGQVAAEDAVASSGATREASEREGPSADAPLALVVEDNTEMASYLADVLGGTYRVRAASDGVEGLERVHELKPDVLVADIAMPGMDGLELCRRLRADGETKHLPILLVTAYRDLGRVLEGFEAGADDYVPKPFHGRELLARVDVHVRLRRMVHEMAHQDRLATLGVLAASVAHRVRNPLTALVSGLPAMRRRLGDHVDGQTEEMFDVLIDCAERIERMTTDLQDLSRVDREEEGEYRPGHGLHASMRLVSARLTSEMAIDGDIDEEAVLQGRAGDMNHVFLNLLDNAARAIGNSGRIEVRGAVEDGAYVVEVADSGPGIDDELVGRIFEPFWTSRPAGEGTGLGLAIAKQVVERQGGTISVSRSQLGGARFVVRLPGVQSAGSQAGAA